MNNIQGDELIIEKISDYIINKYNLKVSIEIKKPLRELFPKPESKGLHSIWSYGHTDISIYRHNKLVCIIEPGGWHYHLKDKKQILRDKKKYILCKNNNVKVLNVVNDIVDNLDLSITKRLFKKYIYGSVK